MRNAIQGAIVASWITGPLELPAPSYVNGVTASLVGLLDNLEECEACGMLASSEDDHANRCPLAMYDQLAYGRYLDELEAESARCVLHPSYEAGYCPRCGTSTRIIY